MLHLNKIILKKQIVIKYECLKFILLTWSHLKSSSFNQLIFNRLCCHAFCALLSPLCLTEETREQFTHPSLCLPWNVFQIYILQSISKWVSWQTWVESENITALSWSQLGTRPSFKPIFSTILDGQSEQTEVNIKVSFVFYLFAIKTIRQKI